jgi:hypothetical protein
VSSVAAESARDKAGEWAENPEDTEVEEGQYSAKHHAIKASVSKTDSETAREAAETARDKAGEWAENPEDAEVETGKYSALHHAAKAAQSAIDAAAASHTQNTDTSLDLGGANPVTAAELVVLKDTTVPSIASGLTDHKNNVTNAHGIQTGESTFAGQVGQTVSISTVASADYHVDITPLAESGRIGEIWISTRAVNAFVVKNSGSDVSSAFAWRISGAALAS